MQLPADLAQTIGAKNVIVFDGECMLCTFGFRFVLKRDTSRRFHFATAQSEAGERIYDRLGLKSHDYDSFIVIRQGRVLTSMDGVIAVLDSLGWPWRAAGVLRILPRPLRDALYRAIARNRTRIFGRRDRCLMPTSDIRDRFLS